MRTVIRQLLLALICTGAFLVSLPGQSAATQQDGLIAGGDYVNAGSYESVNAAVHAARGRTLLIPASHKLTANLIIPADVAVHVAKGGMLVNTANYKVTVQGPFTAGYYQVFDGFKQGEVIFEAGSVSEVYPQWWGGNVSSSIQKALGSFSNVLIPRGVYLVDTEIRVPANSTLRGERGAVLRRPANTAYPRSSMIVNEGFAVDPPSYGDTGILIDGIAIDGNRQGAQSSHANGIYLRSATNVVIRNCTVYNCGRTAEGTLGHGIVFSNVRGGMVQSNVVHGNDGDGIVLYTKNSDVTIMSNNVHDNRVVGIEVEGRLDADSTNYRNRAISITGNMVYGNGKAGHGILLDWSDAISVQGNMVHDNTIYLGAITILGCTDISITGNTVFHNSVDPASPYPKAGIAVTPHVYGPEGISRSVTIANNIIDESYEGISIRGSGSTSIAGNAIRTGPAGTGVTLLEGLSGVIIDGNTVEGGSKGILFGPSKSAYSNMNITGNLFNGSARGISASRGVTISDGFLTNNNFRNIGEKDIIGDRAGPVVLSSFFVQYNIHDKGTQYWDSAGVRPATGKWKAGDRIMSAGPPPAAVSGKRAVSGWLCTEAGSPGKWVELQSGAGD